jgi:hypothetical protein
MPKLLIDLTHANIPYNKLDTRNNDGQLKVSNKSVIVNGKIGRRIYTFLNGKYLLDIVYNNFVVAYGLKLGYVVTKVLDRGVIELLGPYGLSSVLINTGVKIGKLDTGIVTSYALYIVLGLISILFILFLPVLISCSEVTSNDILYILYSGDRDVFNGKNTNEIRLIMIFVSSLILLNVKSAK